MATSVRLHWILLLLAFAGAAYAQAPGTPGAPVITSFSVGDQSITIQFTAPGDSGSSPIIDYLAACVRDATDFQTAAGSGASLTIENLANGAPVECRVSARNAAGLGASSNSVFGTPVAPPAPGVPGRPTIASVIVGDRGATIEFVPPESEGASPVTNYRFSCSGGAAIATAAASPLTITGLSNSQTYACHLVAINLAGAGPPSGVVLVSPVAPIFGIDVESQITALTASATARLDFRPEDVGTEQSIFVFAVAPESEVLGADEDLPVGHAKNAAKDDVPIGCVFAQLNAAGQMVAVNSSNLAAYLTGVLSAQGASVTILDGVPISNVAGATWHVGYGPTSDEMLRNGTNRAAVSIPGSLECRPQRPQTGWWWNPAEDGRGFSLEMRGNNLFFASFLYDLTGRSTWYVSSGPISLDGTLYIGELLGAAHGQTLDGPYTRFPDLTPIGRIAIAFNNATTGTLVWPGGTVPIQRFNIVPDGLNRPPVPGQPQSGWWWNDKEPGRGFFLEFQGGWLDIAGYMYDAQGHPVWYLTVAQVGGTEQQRALSSSWWSYANGQPLRGGWRPHQRVNDNVAPVTINFTGPDTAVLSLPGGRTTALKRHAF